jgi:hypothetical protein
VKRFKGPELKLSELKVPDVLRDLYWDLRDRRLLPLVGLILVGIVAAPFLLSGGGKGSDEPGPTALPGGSAQQAATLTVLPAEPGLREPDKRLAERSATDPFKQRYTSPVLKEGAAPIEESSSGGGSGEGSVETETSGGGGGGETAPAPVPLPESGGGGGGGGSGSLNPGEVQLYTFAIDIRVAHTEATEAGGQKMGEPVKMENVERGTPLPAKKQPVLIYLGPDKDLKNALMLVSTEAKTLLGDNKCVAGTTTCQLLALEIGVPEVVEYGENGARFKFELLKIEPVKGPKIKEPQE